MDNDILYLRNLVSIEKYARLCGVTSRTIHARIRNKRVSAAHFGGYSFIDVEKSPPARRVNWHKQRYRGPAGLVAGIDYRSLVTPERLADSRKMCTSRIYRAILTGRLKAVIAGEVVFVNKQAVEEFLKTG